MRGAVVGASSFLRTHYKMPVDAGSTSRGPTTNLRTETDRRCDLSFFVCPNNGSGVFRQLATFNICKERERDHDEDSYS